jgi:hypothetical protein
MTVGKLVKSPRVLPAGNYGILRRPEDFDHDGIMVFVGIAQTVRLWRIVNGYLLENDEKGTLLMLPLNCSGIVEHRMIAI